LLDLIDLLRKHAATFGTQREYAQALGISEARLNRILNRKSGGYVLNVANCLRFAALSGERASEVLRAAGKGDVAELIEQLYGPGQESLTKGQRDVLRLFEAIDDAPTRHAVLLMIRRLAESDGDDVHPIARAPEAAAAAVDVTPAAKIGSRRTRRH
jgi:hypothetical protein